jgi:hypothetical protein
MDVGTIENWIKSLGRRYDILVAEGAVPNQPLSELYQGRDSLTLRPGAGLELSFRTQTKSLEAVHIILLETMKGMTSYAGELPRPLSCVMNQSDVRATFGVPLESRGVTKLPLNTVIGGWDSYRLDPQTHPNTKLIFTYSENLQVKTLTFTLIDYGHN